MTSSVHTRTVRRLVIDVEDFDDFRDRYEAAAPAYDLAGRVGQLSNWDDVQKDVDAVAHYGFVRYATIDGSPVFAVAGHKARSIIYLMGNHTIAERMYRHEPAVMLYAPLRTVIHQDAAGAVWFSIDQPSTRFTSFGVPAITAVGVELDGLLAALLQTLGVPVPTVLA